MIRIPIILQYQINIYTDFDHIFRKNHYRCYFDLYGSGCGFNPNILPPEGMIVTLREHIEGENSFTRHSFDLV